MTHKNTILITCTVLSLSLSLSLSLIDVNRSTCKYSLCKFKAKIELIRAICFPLLDTNKCCGHFAVPQRIMGTQYITAGEGNLTWPRCVQTCKLTCTWIRLHLRLNMWHALMSFCSKQDGSKIVCTVEPKRCFTCKCMHACTRLTIKAVVDHFDLKGRLYEFL